MNNNHYSIEKLLIFLGKHKIRIIVIAIAVFFFPLVAIHLLFIIHLPWTWLQAQWSAGEVLEYCGSIVGAVATIIAIILTILMTYDLHNKEIKSQERKYKLSIKPHLQTSHNNINRNDAIKLCDGKTIYVTYPLEDGNETPGSSFSLPFLVEKNTSASSVQNVMDELIFMKEHYIIRYSISNVGAGNAINIQFSINEKSVVPGFSLVVNDQIVFVFVFAASLLRQNSREINFNFEYNDVASIGKYEQHEKIALYVDGETLNSSQCTTDMISMPKPTRKKP